MAVITPPVVFKIHICHDKCTLVLIGLLPFFISIDNHHQRCRQDSIGPGISTLKHCIAGAVISEEAMARRKQRHRK